MGRVFIVRHGNTFDRGDTILRVGGQTDLPLSSSGQKQAEALANEFSAHHFIKAYSSDLKRTRETATAILRDEAFEIAAFLTEIDYGPDEGRPESDVIARLGQEALRLWDQEAIPPKDWKVSPEQLREDWAEFLANCPPDGDTLVVTSNGVARFILDVVEVTETAPKKLRTGAYGVIEIAAGKQPQLLSWDVRPNS